MLLVLVETSHSVTSLLFVHHCNAEPSLLQPWCLALSPQGSIRPALWVHIQLSPGKVEPILLNALNVWYWSQQPQSPFPLTQFHQVSSQAISQSLRPQRNLPPTWTQSHCHGGRRGVLRREAKWAGPLEGPASSRQAQLPICDQFQCWLYSKKGSQCFKVWKPLT